jgi:hypothetical protein
MAAIAVGFVRLLVRLSQGVMITCIGRPLRFLHVLQRTLISTVLRIVTEPASRPAKRSSEGNVACDNVLVGCARPGRSQLSRVVSIQRLWSQLQHAPVVLMPGVSYLSSILR